MLSSFSVRKPYTVIVAVVLILVLGIVSLSKMTTDLIPNINLPYAVVMTTYPGASPEQVEDSITKRIESSLASVSRLSEISSVSNENYSMVILEFTQDTDMDSVSLEIRESLDMIRGTFPEGAGSPMIMKLNPNMMPVMVLAADFDNLDRSAASAFVEDKILPALESVAGVASASAGGLVKSNIHVVLSAAKIAAVNDRILEKVDAKLLEGRKQLDEAMAELEQGEKTLAEKQNELAEGKLQVETGYAELEAARAELETKKAQLAEGEKALLAAQAELAAGKTELETAEAGLLASLSQLRAARDAALAAGGDLPAEQLKQLASLEAGLTELEAKKHQMNAAEADLKTQKAELAAGKAALAEGEKQINSGMAELDAAKKGIAQGEAAISAGKTGINEGRAKINSGYEEFEAARDEALKKANIEGMITVSMLSGILKAQNISYPAGYIQQDGDDVLVRVGDDISDINALETLLLIELSELDIQITLEDVADTLLMNNAADTFTKVNGNEAILITLQKQTEYSTAEVASAVRGRMAELVDANEGLRMTALMDQGVYIDMIVGSVGNNLIYGAILAIIILFIFLRDIKLTLVVGVAIPLSVLVALLLMYFSGISLNIISMSGLALGVGMLVDNSIVVIENIYRMRSEGASAKDAAINGTKQVSAAILSSTLTTCAVFVPIVFTEGITKQLFSDLALTIAFSLLASLMVALTFVPMMSAGSLRNNRERTHRVMEKLQNIYARVMEFSLKRKWIPIGLVTLLFAFTVVGIFRMGTAFFPEMDTPQMSVSLIMDEDTTFEEAGIIAQQAMDIIGDIEGVDTVGVSFGRNASGRMGFMSFGGGASGSNSKTAYVLLDEKRNRTNQEIAKEVVEKTRDLDCEVSASGTSMDISMLSGSGISIHIKGRELDMLRDLAADIAALVEEVNGTADVSDGMESPARELRIIVNKDAAMAKGVTVGEIFGVISKELAAAGTVTTLTTEDGNIPVIVTSDSDVKPEWNDLKTYTFKAAATGTDVVLGDVAALEESLGFESITRRQQQRYVTVSSKIAEGYNIGLVGRDIETALAGYEIPAGYSIEIAGENESIKEAMNDMLLMLILAVVFVYLVMVAQFQSLKSPFIVLLTLPLAYTGGFIALILTGQVLSVVAAIGFVMLTGIVVNNGIVLVDYINQLREKGMERHEAIITGGKTRLRPILMTSLTTIFAMLTLSLGLGMGTEMAQPLAITVIGGLIYATLLTLVFVPVLYDVFNHRVKKDRREANANNER